MNTLTVTDLAARWKTSRRTAQRDVLLFRLNPVDVRGKTALFNEAAVVDMENRRRNERLKSLGYKVPSSRIITVAEAKRLAGKTGKNGRGK